MRFAGSLRTLFRPHFLLFLCATACPTEEPCIDGVQDGQETAVDCGGEQCPGCEVGQACVADGDCASNFCVDGTCAPESCGNCLLDSNETNLDEGVECPQRKHCCRDAECDADEVCQARVCSDPTGCDDGRLSGDESDIDCGGVVCEPCVSGRFCVTDVDCLTARCEVGFCL